MLAILDPVLFDPAAPLSPVTLKDLLRLLSHKHAHIPGVDWYWKELQRQLIRPLHARPGYQDLDRLRDFARTVGFPPLPRRVSVWSFRQMFGALSESWVETMARLVTGAVLSREPTVLVTHLRRGRNLTVHGGPGQCTLDEKTCWDLRVQPAGGELCRIPVVCRERNLDVPWTCRFDDRLPAREDAAAFPFCPPPDWRKASVTAATTHESRPTWRDHQGNHWARPATGEGHHWDVYLTQALEEEYGLGQLNITRWGAPEREGAPGSLHHVPKDKQARLHKKTGWSC
jgi:hypothetical protein